MLQSRSLSREACDDCWISTILHQLKSGLLSAAASPIIQPRTCLPSGSVSRLISAWSAQSQMKPPMMRAPGEPSKQAQYASKLPVLLPMECAYSHSITGRGSPLDAASAASACSCCTRAYMGQMTSVAGVREPPPCSDRHTSASAAVRQWCDTNSSVLVVTRPAYHN